MIEITSIFSFFGYYTPIISFIGAIIGGEETLILLSILASHSILNIWYILIFFYIGINVSDLLWFFLGISRIFDWLAKRRIWEKIHVHFQKRLQKGKHSNFSLLFITKFVYGTRVPTIVYMARNGLELRTFFIYTLTINAIWTILITFIGWSAGKGIAIAQTISNNIIVYILLITIVLILFNIITKKISYRIKKLFQQEHNKTT